MAECGCEPTAANTALQRRALKKAFWLNATMFVIGVRAGVIARSSGLIASGLDMLADAKAYAKALSAAGTRSVLTNRSVRSSLLALRLRCAAQCREISGHSKVRSNVRFRPIADIRKPRDDNRQRIAGGDR